MLNSLPIPSFFGSTARSQPSAESLRGGNAVAPLSPEGGAVDISFLFERRPAADLDSDTAPPAQRKSRSAAARYGEASAANAPDPVEAPEAVESNPPHEAAAERDPARDDAAAAAPAVDMPALPSLTEAAVPASPRSTSFLDELAREAQSRRDREAEEQVDREAIERNVKMANQACRVALDYWTSMVEHLVVLKPKAPGRYVFDGRTVIDDACGRDFRVVQKSRKPDHGDEIFEAVSLCWRVGDGAKLRAVKDYPAEADRLRSRLVFSGVQSHESQSINPSTGRPQGTQFEFTAAVNVSVRIVPLHEEGKIAITLCNLDSIERVEAQLPAFALRTKELDELARWICGKPHSFLKHAQNVTRYEP